MNRLIPLAALVVFFAIYPALAQIDKAASPAAAPKVPAISAETKAKFFKAQAAMNAAQLNLEHAVQQLPEYKAQQAATASFQGVIDELGKECGAQFNAGMDPNGDPSCQSKPAPPAPAK